jgi:glutaminyl-tRNA synthetase
MNPASHEESTPRSGSESNPERPKHFIEEMIERDLAAGRNEGRVHTRFPPEPNGYLHIGHAKSIHLNFGMARRYGGQCNLRFDDTNPLNEDPAFVESIRRDIHWLGFDWEDREFHASDYYEQLYDWAVHLVNAGKAYVCELNETQIREYRGTIKEAGRPSPWRDRPAEESLDLLERMRRGEFEEGRYTLRARIDMAAANMKMRDPLIYRIRHAVHHRTGDAWKIYPMYDFAHCLSDAIEGITHSLCTLEFKDNRELYDWFVENCPVPAHPYQTEFARLNLTHTVMSKRKLKRLVEEKYVDGWDDPRLPTLSGMRRRGFTPEAIADFCESIGVARTDSVIEYARLEHHLREDLNARAPRVMAVLDPIKLVITNYPEDQTEVFEAANHPDDPDAGTHEVPFGRELWVERDDFRQEAPRKWFRLAPGKEVRLKFAYFVTCEEVIRNDAGEVVELRCTYDPESRGGQSPDGRKVKGTLHWVSAAHAVECEARLYSQLFEDEHPEAEGRDFLDVLNPESLELRPQCKAEPYLADFGVGDSVQFFRHGYFVVDPDSGPEAMVFNRTVSLRDSWAKMEKKLSAG